MLQQPAFIVKTFEHINEGSITPEKMHSMVFYYSNGNCQSNFPHQHNDIWTLLLTNSNPLGIWEKGFQE
jgi:hypothetical protein